MASENLDLARPSTVQVIVVTNGHENSSNEYSGQLIKKLVTEKTISPEWDFMFLGANRDAVTKAAELGIAHESSLTYAARPAGVQNMTASAGRYVSDRRHNRKAAFSPEERRKSAES